MTRLAIISLLSLALAGVLCYSTLWVAEHIAETTRPRIEITLTEIQP